MISNKTLAVICLIVLMGLNVISTSRLNNEDEDYMNNEEFQPKSNLRSAKSSRLIETCTDLMENQLAWYSVSDTLRDMCLIYLNIGKQNRPRATYPFMRERKFFALHMNKNNRLNQNEVSNARGFKYGK